MLTADSINQYALPAFLLAILVEALVSFVYQKAWYQPRDTALSLGFWCSLRSLMCCQKRWLLSSFTNSMNCRR